MRVVVCWLVMVLIGAMAHGLEEVSLATEIPEGSREEVWSRALAEQLGGKAAVTVPYGRADVVTETEAIEVDRLSRWHGALGQALHYAHATDKQAVIAFVFEARPTPDERKLLAYIETVARKSGVRVMVVRYRGSSRK